jgi:hypothetical protein
MSVAGALLDHRLVLLAFLLSLALVIVGGSLFVFLVKGGTVGVLVRGERDGGQIEVPPLQPEVIARASAFSIERFTESARSLFPRYARLGFALMVVYLCSGAAYVAAVVGKGGDEGWGLTTLATIGFVLWTTLVNLLYLLVQMVIAAEDCSVLAAARRVLSFVGRAHRRVGGVFLVILGMVLLATAASIVAFAALGLIILVPFVWLAAVPLQLIAVLLRAVVLQYISLTSIGAYLHLYREFNEGVGRGASMSLAEPLGGPLTVLDK